MRFFCSKLIKPLKRIKGLDQLPQPYINFMDDRNVEFLSFSDQKPMLKGNSETIVIADHKTIEAKIDFDKEKNP
jgi:hypothetical protein